MQNGTPTAPGEVPSDRPADAMLALCAGLLPVWVRHLSTSRAQSEVAVTQMMQAFADIGPHINMAERQSQQINDALAQPVGGVTGLVEACEQLLGPGSAGPQLVGRKPGRGGGRGGFGASHGRSAGAGVQTVSTRNPNGRRAGGPHVHWFSIPGPHQPDDGPAGSGYGTAA
jgi:hypothetical protein